MTIVLATEPRSLALADDELIPVLQSSLYPGAKPESIKLALGYCRAAGLDPIQKPVHLVPMRVKKVGGGRDDYEWRDVVMPGIGLYRTQASRTGELAGIDEPEFGPLVRIPGVSFEVPEWCKVTVYRVVSGQRVGFTACEFWSENYATAGRDSSAPNSMWSKRPRGQIAKCAEAQALRKAFPELGSQPTADETLIEPNDFVSEPAPEPIKVPRKSAKASPAPAADADVVDAEVVEKPAATQNVAPATSNVAGGDVLIGAGEIAYLKNKARAVNADIAVVLADMGGLVLEKLTKADFANVKAHLMAME